MVRDPDLVGIGKAEYDPDLLRILAETGPDSGLLSYQPGRLPDAGEYLLECAVETRRAQRLSEPASATTLLVEAGAPFSK